jgi:hypothetical protein
MKNIHRLKEITITIIISYLITSYVSNEFNPFKLTTDARLVQVFIATISIFVHQTLRDEFKNK